MRTTLYMVYRDSLQNDVPKQKISLSYSTASMHNVNEYEYSDFCQTKVERLYGSLDPFLLVGRKYIKYYKRLQLRVLYSLYS